MESVVDHPILRTGLNMIVKPCQFACDENNQPLTIVKSPYTNDDISRWVHIPTGQEDILSMVEMMRESNSCGSVCTLKHTSYEILSAVLSVTHMVDEKYVYGKILTLTRTDCQRMDFYELVPLLKRYRRLYLSQNGENFFTYQSVSPKQGLLPSKAYLGMIIDGLKAGGFTPQEYIKEIALTNCLAEMTITSNLNFLVKYDDSNKSIASRILRTYDNGLLWIFINVFKGRSLTAWLIKT